MILLYRILTTILYPVFVILIYLRKMLKKEDSIRFREKIFPKYFNVKRDRENKLIWFHAASVGELKSILPLVNELNNKNKKLEFLITTITITSAQLAKDEFRNFNNVHHRFFPIDSGFLMKKFINLWKPKIIFLVDSEIWPNLIFIAKKNNILLAMLNARITKKTYKKWMLFPDVAKKIFTNFDICLSSSLETKKFLFDLNAKNIFFLGNLKLADDVVKKNYNKSYQDFFKYNKCWAAISTHKSEEELCLNVHLILKSQLQNLKTIIAPRHINRVNDIKKICEDKKLTYQVLQKGEKILTDKEVILVNFYGELPIFLKNINSVFLGKSTIKKLKNVGGQNPIDAAKLGCKIYHGPFVYNFQEIYELFNDYDIAKEIRGLEDLASQVKFDFDNPEKNNLEISKKIIKLGQQTLEDTMEKINELLKK